MHIDNSYLNLHSQLKSTNSHINIVSWNVRGFTHPIKWKMILDQLKRFITEIAFLHETYLRDSDNSQFLAWLDSALESQGEYTDW